MQSTDGEVKTYFEEFGEVATMQVQKNSNGKAKGYAYFRFADKETQEKARHSVVYLTVYSVHEHSLPQLSFECVRASEAS